MPTHATKKLDGSQLELTITVTPAEYEPHLKRAAAKISERKTIKGFRPGKAPFDRVKQEVGEMAIMQEALEPIVQKTFVEVIMADKLETVGPPKLEVEKVAPGNDLVYKATVAILPELKLPDLNKLKVENKEVKIDDASLNETLDALRGMHANEVEKDGPAEGTDKLTLDMNMTIDKVPVDGGQAKDHGVYLSEKHYIPGFNEKVEGMRKGDERTFSLDFPEEHYQKHLAGKTVDFAVTATSVHERQLPEIDDEFAKKLGQESADKLKELIRNNMLREAEQKEGQRVEIAILDQLIEKTKFDAIPEVIIDSERQKMFYELQRDLERTGISIEQYLNDIKKDEKQLFEDFRVQAEKRAKAALISRQVAKNQEITVSDEEIEKEIETIAKMYEHNKEAQDNLKKQEVRDSIATTMQNRKVMEWLKAEVLETK